MSLTVGESKVSQALVFGFCLRQRRLGNNREVKDSIQFELNAGEFCVLHLTFKGDDRARFHCLEVGIKHMNELGVVLGT